MKKSIQVLILLVIFLAGNVVVSAPVSVETAKTVAINFVKNVDANPSYAALSLVYSSDNFYVFSNESTWVIISADDRAYPVLGYSTESLFNIPVNEADTNVSNNFWGWIRQIEQEISYARENNLSASAEISQLWQDLKEDYFVPSDGTTAVEPLLTTTWGQEFPYNAMCPAGAVTGCVATAMGQILKYWNYPEQGLGSYGYAWEAYPYTGANFGATTYNWANMPNSISEENADIATLLYHTAVSCRSMWGDNTGVAYSSNSDPMTVAFVNYFKMAYSSIQYIQKSNMPDAWESLIQAELNAGRPVYYRGDGVGSHAWVCDGVDANNLYHFNWGWDGIYNGYFALTAITPGNYNFTSNQAAIIGIQPNDGSTLVENTTWSGAISKATSIAVPFSIILDISPGTIVEFDQNSKLRIWGKLISIGDADNYIKLTASNPNGWEGIDFVDNDGRNRMLMYSDSSTIKYTQIEYSKSSGLYCNHFGKVVVEYCKINNNDAGIWNGATNQTGGYGGGIALWQTSLNIYNCKIYNNYAAIGGAGLYIGNDNGLSKIHQNEIYNNISAIDGGGICLNNVSYAILENNIIHHNSAAKGAGCIITFGNPTIVNNKFCNNTVPINGGYGCLYIENSNPKIINNLISNNMACGIVCKNTSSIFLNNTIVNNNHKFAAGMVFDENSNPMIKNSIIYGNIANNANYGHQITIWNSNCDPYFDHCNIQGGLSGFGGTGSGVNYNVANYTNNINLNPLFVDPSAGAGSGYNGLEADWSLQSQSLCIDAGDTSEVSQYLPHYDLGGKLRINNELIDIGAYEYQQFIYHNISLTQGWNGISSWIMPQSNKLTYIFYQIEELIILQNMTQTWWPAQNINTIGNWNSYDGYKIKTSEAVNLTISGTVISNRSLSLNQSWNLIPVLSECNVNVEDLFDQTNVVLVKEVAGWRLYWPEFGINTLGYLQPGKAYFVLMMSQTSIMFPECNYNKSESVSHNKVVPKFNIPLEWLNVNPTPLTHTIAISKTIENLCVDDVIGVVDLQGVCYGYTIWNGKNTGIVVYGDDPTTSEKDGFYEGEKINFIYYSIKDKKFMEMEIEFDENFPSFDGKFIVDGISVLKTGNTTTTNDDQIWIYPNPCHGKFTISCDQNISAVYLQDVKGRMLNPQISLNPPESSFVKEVLVDLPKGLYFVHVYMGSERAVRKVIIK